MHTWITRIYLLLLVIIATKDVLGCGNNHNDKSKKTEKNKCWYELWYFWLIVTLFLSGAVVIIFFYCKVRVKNTRLQNAGRRRNPQMFLPPPPPSYETPGHQPPPYHIAVSVSVQFQEVSGSYGSGGIGRRRQPLDGGNDLMEVEEVSDNHQFYPQRCESVPPPYTLMDDVNNNNTTNGSHHGRSNLSSATPAILHVPSLHQVYNSNNNFLTQNTHIPQQEPPAYFPNPTYEYLPGNSHVSQTTARACSVQASLTISSPPPSTTTSIPSALSANDARPQGRTTTRGATNVARGTSSNQSVLNETNPNSRRVSNGHFETTSVESRGQTTVVNVTDSSLNVISTLATNNTPVSTDLSSTERLSTSTLGRSEASHGVQRRGSDNTLHNANKRPSLGAIRYANHFARKNSQDLTNGGASASGAGPSRRGSNAPPPASRLPVRGSKTNPRGGSRP